ncbi:transposase [Atopobium sp. oral taxon 416]|uniref:transposase n=1 Tax=Atopobium sp. oral taxon 416 TaxID=712157 RepID=UPI002111CCE0|nr:transposase [Atopobium sp. oral taxon 416]
MEEICGRGFSKQAVSQACAELDEALERFRNRPIEGGRVRPKALLVAIGLTPTGDKEVLGVELADGEINVAEAAPKGLRAGLRSKLAEMFNCPDRASAERRRDEIAADYRERAPRAVERLLEGFDDAMTVMALPAGDMRRCTRTSNYLECLNREIKRRSRAVGVFPSPESALRLATAVLMREDE